MVAYILNLPMKETKNNSSVLPADSHRLPTTDLTSTTKYMSLGGLVILLSIKTQTAFLARGRPNPPQKYTQTT